MNQKTTEPASFRDPDGYVFYSDGGVYRFVGQACLGNFQKLCNSGLYDKLVQAGQLIPSEKCDNHADDNGIIVRSEKIDFISYPYQWCFSQYQDAALLTLDIMKTALKHDMWLKDASAYNVQFHKSKPIFIDTLSFEKYPEGSPWVAYRQFCQHFLAPLLLMSKVDIRLNGLMQNHIDGIPLDLASKLLPFRQRLSPFIFVHIFLHAHFQKKHGKQGQEVNTKVTHLSRQRLQNILLSLRSTVASLRLPKIKTEWGDYYEGTNYSDSSFEEKKKIVTAFLNKIPHRRVCDLGANTGEFSRLEQLKASTVIACDVDGLAVEKNYCYNRKENIENILPLLLDLTNPTPAIGWSNQERRSFLQRCKADTSLALALIHHLAISNNVPLTNCAELFASLTKYLIIEFVPKEDSQVQKLLSTRPDIFPDYHKEGFEKAFVGYFNIIDKKDVDDSCRTIYVMEKT